MNTPTDFLQGIHDTLGRLPSDLASLLQSSAQGPDLGDFQFPDSSAAGMPTMPEMPTGGAAQGSGISGGFDMPNVSASFPDFPSFGMPDIPDASFPSMPSAGSPINAGDAFPAQSGYEGSQYDGPIGAPASRDTDVIMLGHLEAIARNTESRSGVTGGTPGFEKSRGPVQAGQSSFYVADMDNDEGFSQSSPSVNASSTAGLRGAGGHGFSRYSRQASALHGSGPSRGGQDQFLEGGR